MARGCLNEGGSLKTVTVNLKSVSNLESESFPSMVKVPKSVEGRTGAITYFDSMGSKVMKLGNLLITLTGLNSSSENFGRGYSSEVLNLRF